MWGYFTSRSGGTSSSATTVSTIKRSTPPVLNEKSRDVAINASAPPPVSDTTIAAIPNVAAHATELLDGTDSNIRKKHNNTQPYQTEITSTREILTKVRYQRGFHTAEVATALATLHTIIESLSQVVVVTSSSNRVALDGVMDELSSARKNLLSSLPANVYEAADNKLRDGVQVNAEVGGAAVEGRSMSAVYRNEAANGFQINAPVRGDMSAMMQLAAMYAKK
ncbi:hypothetical protein B0T14DRAFT_561386 [Immersiella caudata]|uniref:Uncharacterized protein n=1 Tax=Immersiella caudata TaxID=314043 RepID=A0AA40CDW1_9PEZI|nr:hypothetical protein B0T14DRAFT_561386 [Immersiella caudata]